MRNRMIAGNWKMNKTYVEGVELAQGLADQLADGTGDVDVVVCPPTVDLKGVSEVIEQSEAPFALGAQNVYFEESGAFTGETAPNMLEAVGATYCIIGHSERRGYFGETNEDVNRKVRALLDGGLYAVACVGESLSVRDEGGAEEFVCAQVRAAFAGLEPEEAGKCVVAYEPIWAIGTGRTATPEQAQDMCAAIRATLADMFGDETADEMRILYGGSMNVGNVEQLLAQPDIDGGLVGGASLKADQFVQLVKACL